LTSKNESPLKKGKVQYEESSDDDDKPKLELMSKDDAKVVMKNKDFENFVNRTTRLIERAMNSEYDLLGNFFEDDGDGDKNNTKQKGNNVNKMFTFQEDSDAVKRAISSIDWSPKVNELLLCSYSKSSGYRPDESEGLINLWSLNLRNRPEL
jgi:dynein intermediate chain